MKNHTKKRFKSVGHHYLNSKRTTWGCGTDSTSGCEGRFQKSNLQSTDEGAMSLAYGCLFANSFLITSIGVYLALEVGRYSTLAIGVLTLILAISIYSRRKFKAAACLFN